MEGELKVLGFRPGLVLNLGTPQKPRAVTESELGTWAKSGPQAWPLLGHSPLLIIHSVTASFTHLSLSPNLLSTRSFTPHLSIFKLTDSFLICLLIHTLIHLFISSFIEGGMENRTHRKCAMEVWTYVCSCETITTTRRINTPLICP